MYRAPLIGGGAYLDKPYYAKPYFDVQESDKPYFAKPGNYILSQTILC